MSTFAQRVMAFNRSLTFDGPLPPRIRLLNPFRDHPQVLTIAGKFYKKYYADNQPRRLILGINPGRLGGGATGVPFTDAKRMKEQCGIDFPGPQLHELSSVFVYDVVAAFGGPAAFYAQYYINSVCPLGFTIVAAGGREKNYNYYDDKALQAAVTPFIEWNLRQQLDLGCDPSVCFCMGMDKNFKFLQRLNGNGRFFGRIVPLQHPRFVMQYRLRSKDQYVQEYVEKLTALY